VIIWVHPDVPEDLKDRVWMHEFGHAFGLDHDRLQSSIMFPTAAGRPKELSDRDIKLLKEAYVQ
jgi:predicted Zn-dependent protease